MLPGNVKSRTAPFPEEGELITLHGGKTQRISGDASMAQLRIGAGSAERVAYLFLQFFWRRLDGAHSVAPKRIDEGGPAQAGQFGGFALFLQIGILFLDVPLDGRPCIVFTDLNKRYDTICFALMHELYHVMNSPARFYCRRTNGAIKDSLEEAVRPVKDVYETI